MKKSDLIAWLKSWDAGEFERFEAENLTPEKLLASLEAIGL